MAAAAIDCLVAELTLVTVRAVHHVLTVVDAVREVAILIVVTLRNQVTVLDVSGAVSEVTILERSGYHKPRHVRDIVLEFLVLLKEWSIKIKITAVLHRIPSVTPPLFHIINREFVITVVGRDNPLARFITLPVVEFA